MIKYRQKALFTMFVMVFAFYTIATGQEAQDRESTIKQQVRENENKIAAIINGKRVITQKEVDASIAAQLDDLQEQIHFLRKNSLDNLLTNIALEEEAKTRGISVEELKNVLISDKVKIDERQVEKMYLDNISSFGAFSKDEAQLRIRLDLESQERVEIYKARVSEIKAKMKIDVRLMAPVPMLSAVDKKGPLKGSLNAPITIVEFSDFQCPYCRQASTVFNQVLGQYRDKVNHVYKHFPLSIHPQAEQAARASVCADRQGKFWQYHDFLFTSTGDMSTPNLLKAAQAVGLDIDQYNACLASGASKEVVMRDLDEGNKLRVQGT